MHSVKRILKITGIFLLCVILGLVVIVGGYALYLTCQFYRIADNQTLEITQNKEAMLNTNQEYTITTYNIGFGAYSQDFTFFMDAGEMKDGTKTQGTGSRAKSKETVERNTLGAIRSVADHNADIMLFQEVDTSSHRSYFINQYESIQSSFTNYSSSFASNFHSGYLFYPLTSPHGTVNAGVATLSKYKVESAVRRSFPIDESFPNKFFDLDRCFTINKMPIENSDKYLVLINLHMSAYDEGGIIRAQQFELLMNYMSSEYAQGNYVIAGGDWNHDIADSINLFKTDQKVPSWVAEINDTEIPAGFSLASATNVPTCRATDIAYTKNTDGSLVNYSIVLDGYMVSDNVKVNLVHNIDTDFNYSDHNPALMKFELIQ
ncbi:MAG: endonuclease/exonuclease/phosphatase family protein [Clostridia bacterium]|nr:endonuclease/exonuclease/phosphatase family protein [Clostridia bacterium]